MNNMTVHGHSVRDMVIDTGMTLKAYCASVKHILWASPIEVCLAARFLDVDVVVKRSNYVKGTTLSTL